MKGIKGFVPRKHGVMTGKETEGELAGEIVCPVINLWSIDNHRQRVRSISKIAHDVPVIVKKEARDTLDTQLYFVESKLDSSIKGWVTERFVQLDG